MKWDIAQDAAAAARAWGFKPRDRDRSAEGGETAKTGSTEGKSPGRKASPIPKPPNHPSNREAT